MSSTDPLPQGEDHVPAGREELSPSLPSPPMDALPVLDQPAAIARPTLLPRGFPLHPNFWWAILWCIGLLLFTQIPGGVVSVVLLFVGMALFPDRLNMKDMGDMKVVMQNPIGLISFGVGLVVAHGLIILFAIVLLRILAGRDWPRQVALRLPALAHVLLGVVVMPAFIVLANGAYYVIRHILHVPSLLSKMGMDMGDVEGAFSPTVLPIAVFVIAVMPGLSEELWCRAFLGRGLVGKHGLVLGVLGTSFLFGLIHVDPAQGMMAMLMGIMLHYVYLTTRSLLMPMLMHFLNNAMAVSVGTLFPSLAQIDKEIQTVPGVLNPLFTGAGALLVAVCWALYQSRARLVNESEAAWQPPYPGVVCPPPHSGTRIVTPALSLLSVVLVAAGVAACAGGFAVALGMGRIR